MALDIRVQITGTKDVAKRLADLGEDAPKAQVRAINRTLTSLKTATIRALARNVGLRNKDVEPSIGLVRATWSSVKGRLTVTGRRIPLIAFGARGPEPSRGRGRGVSYRLAGGRSVAPNAFIARMRSGHRGVFQRVDLNSPGQRRSEGGWSLNLPITELHGPSLPGAMIRAGILHEQERNAATLLEKNLLREAQWIAQKRVHAGSE